MLEAVIFDMDGVLIDSEPIWQDVELELLGNLGVPLTRDMCAETMGLRVNEAVAHWHDRYPWSGPGVEEAADELIDGVIRAIAERGQAMEGVMEALVFLEGLGLRLAIASSSYYRVIEAVLARCDLEDRFEVVHSAEDEANGKPHPAVYLGAAAKLAVAPARCVAVEDSPNGVQSAKRAGMACIAIPELGTESDPRFADADLVLTSLAHIEESWATVAGL